MIRIKIYRLDVKRLTRCKNKFGNPAVGFIAASSRQHPISVAGADN